MTALTGLTGIAGLQVKIDKESQASPEDRSGNVANPKHGERGETATPYIWESTMTPGGSHGPYGPENQLLGDTAWLDEPAGFGWEDPDFDFTPATHAAPNVVSLSGAVPGTSPDDTARHLRQSMRAHSVNTGASARAQHSSQGWALQDDWESFDNVHAGHTEVRDVPGQMKSAGFGWGTTDRVQSFARQNSYGFDSAHTDRRWATGSIPGNTYWMRPGGRPLVKSLAGPARPPVGVSSPFAGQDLGTAFGIGGAVLMDMPTEYVAPPQPNLAVPRRYTEPIGDPLLEWY
jgi:hypothetical protein